MNELIKKQMLKHNEKLLDFAAKHEEAIYLKENDQDEFRTPFFRDIDRILYSLSFIRYQDKTQVFPKMEHDHISKRMIHVQFVSKIARTIGRALGLNEDLIEAASLGHDLGHAPFGHEGEYILNEISLACGEGYFNHNIQSVRTLMNIENYGKGQNITLQVLDAIMCHNGEVALGKYTPDYKKSKKQFLNEYASSYQDKSVILKMKPMTLEGCVVRISDLIAYLGRDIDDAIRLGLIKRNDIPKKITDVLGSNTKEIVNNCILDIVRNSFGKDYILLSDKLFEAIEELKKFNYANIYSKSMTKERKIKLKEMFNTLFLKYIDDIKTNNESSPIIYSYLKNMSAEYKKSSCERIALDYIAGMTDDYFLKEYEGCNHENN